jgi:hypothetical protein
MRRAWDWLTCLPPWQRVAVVAVLVVVATLAGLRLWDALGAFVAALFGLGGGSGAAKVGARAVATRRAAKAAASLGEAIADAADTHAAEDAKADAELARAQGEVVDARHADAPADDMNPQRSEYLGER